MAPLTKQYSVFDCDSHITELTGIWDYLSRAEQKVVKPWFWPMDHWVLVNGKTLTHGYWDYGRAGLLKFGAADGISRIPSAVESSGPGVDKMTIRTLRSMRLTEAQCDYTDHKGARDPHARLADMDRMGIDQVAVIPLMMIQAFVYLENVEAAALVARAYNDWVYDWCSADRTRLFPCAALPVQSPVHAAEELRRVAAKGFRVAGVRAVEVYGRYPNQPAFEPLWQAFAETGVVPGMHSLPQNNPDRLDPARAPWRPYTILDRAVAPRQLQGASQTMGFINMAVTWLAGVLLSGFLEQRPGLARMAIMESNAAWLPALLDDLDRAFLLYRNERAITARRLPSEIFAERCFIAFEGDESPVYRQHRFFAGTGIWSSDVYHHDGADAWKAIREMEKLSVPQQTQAKLMGGNAQRMYRVEPKLVVTQEPPPVKRPAWYPTRASMGKSYAPLMRVI